ncbi:MAG TPA: prepilin peptidase [Paraburkholderia sp.]|uniref:A24 family peptidase n=1 Tax=Paraburkholderia sp. TaxID=1926495 RepID=UPI002ED242B8
MQYATKFATCLVLASLSLSDLRFRRLPTRAVLLVACLYGVDAAVTGISLSSLAAHAAAATLSFVGFALLFKFGWMGGGDVKLAAAVFLWAGTAYAWPVFFVVSCCGLMLGVTMLALDRYRNHRTARSPRGSRHDPRHDGQHAVPYGVALAAGGIAAVWLPLLNPL